MALISQMKLKIPMRDFITGGTVHYCAVDEREVLGMPSIA